MAYPPTVPTGTRINTTNQVDLHPTDHNQIHAALTDIVNVLGSAPQGSAASVAARFDLVAPVGCVLPYAGATAPSGWALCDSTAISRSENPLLFALIGTTYGAGDGSTTFNKPNLTNRFVAGKGPVAWSDVLGETGGQTDAIAAPHIHGMPNHDHTVTVTTSGSGSHAHNEGSTGSFGWLYIGAAGDGNFDPFIGSAVGVDRAAVQYVQPSTSSSGSTHSHTSTGTAGSKDPGDTNSQSPSESATNKNLPPYITLNYIIRLG